ncbi:hypothetical protein L915_10482 [Phytophthora nicotianae]|uniref:Mitochondrial cardiolipin hydrolase n=1 Tax=Phytophthora nicotianae TaxID=4792 RepID=W2GQJ6_PHYNI|nr:hypothetical protein L915_10482 [Phytophthora nicotianae]
MALLHRLEDNAVTGADLAFYALTDIAFCHALIWLHQLHKRVRVVIDRKWVRSCPSAIESVELLIAAGIDVRHRNPIIHYKLLILTYKDDIFVSSGSANLTTAAWNRNDELLVQTMGPPGVETKIASNQVKLLLHGGDTMLGRAVQLTFPFQAPNQELIIKVSTTVGTYFLMALHYPHNNPVEVSSHEMLRWQIVTDLSCGETI